MEFFYGRKLRSAVSALGLSMCVACFATSPEAEASEPFIAEIVMFGGNFAPRGWAFCEGQLLPIAQYTALFSLLGTTYGGNGRTDFALPDLRGRTAIGPGQGPGLTNYRLGEQGGVETVALGIQQIPSHNHTATASATLRAYNGRGNKSNPGGNALAEKLRTNIYSASAPDVSMAADSVSVGVTVNNSGGSQPHENRMPFLAINHIIALQGIFPSRN